jgi:hypothetical protein
LTLTLNFTYHILSTISVGISDDFIPTSFISLICMYYVSLWLGYYFAFVSIVTQFDTSFKIFVLWTCILKSCLVIVNSSYVSFILNCGYVAMRKVCYWLSFLLATSKELHSCEKRWLHWRGNHPFFFLAMGGVWFFLVLHMVVINKSFEQMFFFQFLLCCWSGDKK